VAVVGGVVLGFFLSIYAIKGYTVPIGWDASEYVWRTRLAQQVGVAHIEDPLPSSDRPKRGRPGFPVVGATLSSVLGASVFRVTAATASVLAVAIGLAAGAFVAALLRRPSWQLAVVALVVGLSPSVIALMKPEGYLDTMLAAAVFMAAAIPIVLCVESPAALVPAILLLGAGATIHWSFFLLVVGTLGLCALAYLPSSWRRWRNGEPLMGTPSLRMGEVTVGGAALGAGLLFGLLGNGLPMNRVDVSEFAKKLQRDLPKYRFPITLSMATLGVVSLARDGRGSEGRAGRARFVLAFLLSWCAVVLAGYLARTVFDFPVAAHRFLSFAMAIPILGIIGVLWLADLASRFAKILGAAVVVVILLGSVVLARQEWFVSTKPWASPTQLRQAALAGSYLDAARVPTDAPFVVVVGPKDWNDVGLMGHILRAGLPPERVPHLYVYVGNAESFLAQQPVDTDVSRSYFERMRSVYADDPVTVMLSSFNAPYYGEWAATHPGSMAGEGLAVVQGPVPSGPIRQPALGVEPFAWWRLGLLGVAYAAVLGLIGLGWAIAMLRRWLRPAEILAVAPAVGIAALVVWGILADRIGIRLSGLGGTMVALAAAAAGGVLAAAGIRSGWARPEATAAAPKASGTGSSALGDGPGPSA
jgi:hypothetical protein